MQRYSRQSRRGFTLIELLMVIVIIGLLAMLGTRAAFQALRTAKESSIFMEISQMDQALSEYKTGATTFPPCMGDANVTSRQSRFYTHILKAFPRYTVPDFNGDGYKNYVDIQQQILLNFGGTAAKWYDLDTMDHAEALVFWLSGFPTPRQGGVPTGQLMSSSKIMGFCPAPTNPFFDKTGMPLGVFSSAGVLNQIDRRAPLFAFEETRLVDQDGDGWLEYLPVGSPTPLPGATPTVPPYVYFDGDLYTLQATSSGSATTAGLATYKTYPSAATGMTGPQPSTVPSWGFAVPFARSLPANGTAQLEWINPRKFQIICAGLDNAYGIMGTPPSSFNASLPKIWPVGLCLDPNGADLDNLTNFSDGRKLGDGLQ